MMQKNLNKCQFIVYIISFSYIQYMVITGIPLLVEEINIYYWCKCITFVLCVLCWCVFFFLFSPTSDIPSYDQRVSKQFSVTPSLMTSSVEEK